MESSAKEQMEKTLKELAKDPESVKVDNQKIVYSDDSLCIIHFDFTAKNGLGNSVTDRCEYIFIESNGKNYEFYSPIENEDGGVYVTEEAYNKQKKGTIYEKLDYPAGLRYLAAIATNTMGREAGSREGKDFTIPVPTGTGSWDLKAFSDEFGETGLAKYLVLAGSGEFSNSATTGSEMTAFLFVDKLGDMSFKLVEYNSNVVKSDDSYTYKIKDSTGKVIEMRLYNDEESGQMAVSGEDQKALLAMLEKGGTITVAVRNERGWGYTPDTYLFKMNVTGYNKAKALL